MNLARTGERDVLQTSSVLRSDCVKKAEERVMVCPAGQGFDVYSVGDLRDC